MEWACYFLQAEHTGDIFTCPVVPREKNEMSSIVLPVCGYLGFNIIIYCDFPFTSCSTAIIVWMVIIINIALSQCSALFHGFQCILINVTPAGRMEPRSTAIHPVLDFQLCWEDWYDQYRPVCFSVTQTFEVFPHLIGFILSFHVDFLYCLNNVSVYRTWWYFEEHELPIYGLSTVRQTICTWPADIPDVILINFIATSHYQLSDVFSLFGSFFSASH